MNRIRSLILRARLFFAGRVMTFALCLLPEGQYKARLIYAFHQTNAGLLEDLGEREAARELRHKISPLRVGGRRADRARNRKR